MNTADFLFPSDLEVTKTGLSKVLFVGSCLSEIYVKHFRALNPAVTYDFVLFNNASDLPSKSLDEIAIYDLQYVQIPLRSVLTDAVIRIEDGARDWVEIGKQNIDLMLQAAMIYNRRAGLLTLLSSFIVPQGRVAPSLVDQDSDLDLVQVIRQLNIYLADSARQFRHTYVADVDMIANSLGKRFFLDDAICFYNHGSVFFVDWSAHERTPHWTAPERGRIEDIPDLSLTYENRNSEFFDAVWRQIEAIFRTVKQIDMVKVVIFDLDNTMWRGQLVEHYQSGLKWPYTDGWPLGIWEAIHHLKRRGIVVTIASKNDENLVKQKWGDVVDPPFVAFEDFLGPRIGWGSKAEAIGEILDSLSLTPKSALFIDDNPVERESVNALLPGIRVIGADPFVVRRLLLWAPEMQIATVTEESKRRDDMLKRQFDRDRVKSSMSRSEFLNSLGSTIHLFEITSNSQRSFARVFELVNKTNQFNTKGIRWSAQDYEKLFESGGSIVSFTVKDRFVDYGTVGAFLILGDEILQFVMSCRVLGMDVEVAAIDAAVKFLRSKGKYDVIRTSIEITEANSPCRDVFSRAGFVERQERAFVLEANCNVTSVSHVSINW